MENKNKLTVPPSERQQAVDVPELTEAILKNQRDIDAIISRKSKRKAPETPFTDSKRLLTFEVDHQLAFDLSQLGKGS